MQISQIIDIRKLLHTICVAELVYAVELSQMTKCFKYFSRNVHNVYLCACIPAILFASLSLPHQSV